MATGDLCSLEDVREYIALDDASADGVIERLITAQSKQMQSWMNRTIPAANYIDVRNGDNTTRMMLNNYPVLSVSSVTINEVQIPQSSTSAGYGWIADDRLVYLRGGLTFAGVGALRGVQNVVIQYRAGYETIPEELRQACVELVLRRYAERDRIGMTSKSIQGETVAFDTKDFPPAVKTILSNYKRVVPQ